MSMPSGRSGPQATGRPFLRWPPHRWVLVLVLASLIWRLIRYGLNFPIWGDEAFIAVNFITRGLGEMAGSLDHPQIVPVGFLWAEWLISRVLGTGGMALRCLPVVAGGLAVWVFWRMAPKMVGRRQAMAAVAIFAASYYPVRHSVEVKSYSLDLLIALVLLWQAWALCRDFRSIPRWVVFFVSGAAAVWCSYPSVFIIGGSMFVMGYCLYQQRAKASWYAMWAMGGVVMAGSFFAMWELVAVGQAVHHEGIEELAGWARSFPPVDSPVGLVKWFFRAHTGNMMAYPIGGNHGGSTATFCLVILGIVALWRTGHRLALGLLLSPLPLMFLAAALKKYPYGDSARVEQHIAPAICLIAGAGLVAFLNHGWKKRGVVTGMRIVNMALLGIILLGMGMDLYKPYKKESDRVAKQTVLTLAGQTAPGDTWVVFGSLGGEPYAPDFLPWGGSLARFRYDLLEYQPTGTTVLWAPPTQAVPAPMPGSSTWLIFYHDDDAKRYPFPEDQANTYLDTVKARLGEPTSQTFMLKEGSEQVDVYRFE